MTHLGLILLGYCGVDNKPFRRYPRCFTWDLVADLGIERTLDVLRGKSVVYLSSITQSNIEITKLVSPVDPVRVLKISALMKGLSNAVLVISMIQSV